MGFVDLFNPSAVSSPKRPIGDSVCNSLYYSLRSREAASCQETEVLTIGTRGPVRLRGVSRAKPTYRSNYKHKGRRVGDTMQKSRI